MNDKAIENKTKKIKLNGMYRIIKELRLPPIFTT